MTVLWQVEKHCIAEVEKALEIGPVVAISGERAKMGCGLGEYQILRVLNHDGELRQQARGRSMGLTGPGNRERSSLF